MFALVVLVVGRVVGRSAIDATLQRLGQPQDTDRDLGAFVLGSPPGVSCGLSNLGASSDVYEPFLADLLG